MEQDLISRRLFLLRSSSAAALPLLTGASAHTILGIARQAASIPRPAGFFSPAQLAVIEAAANRIFPAVDGEPNASAMHAPRFIDLTLQQVLISARKPYADGIRTLDARARKVDPSSKGFASLTEAQQDAILTEIEKTPFFGMLAGHTVAACFADPKYGGNFEETGFKLIGLEHHGAYQPPFGYYDAQAHEAIAAAPVPSPLAPSFVQAGSTRAARHASEADVDFVIVGAGIAGGSVAWELSRAGYRVVVF